MIFPVYILVLCLTSFITFMLGDIYHDDVCHYFSPKKCARIVFWPLTCTMFLMHGLIQLIVEDNPFRKKS